MKIIVISSALLVAAASIGCGRPGDISAMDRAVNTAQSKGLAVTIQVPRRKLTPRQALEVVVLARNVSSRTITITPESRSLVVVRLLRHTVLGWEQVKRYPRSSAMVVSPWRLAAKQQRRFVMNLTVEPDWPEAEILQLSAELDGWPAAAPRVTVHVAPAEKTAR